MKSEKKPSFKAPIILTIILGFAFYYVVKFYLAVMPSLNAAVAVNQVHDSTTEYAASQAFMRSDTGMLIPWIIFLLLLLAIWWKILKYYFSDSSDGNSNKDEQ